MIKIKASHKGLFTKKAKAAGTSVAALAARDSKPGAKVSAKTKKQAVFAKVSKTWHHSK
jgi:hypothetical protein